MISENSHAKDRRRVAAIGIALISGFLVTLLAVSGCQQTASSVVVDFPDPELEAAIRNAIGIQTRDIHNTDLDELTDVYVDPGRISNLEGIQHCTNLTSLELGHNQIRDISPLSGLTNLTFLNLSDNQIRDISPLSGLTNLAHTLYLSNNQIHDISPLSKLIHLTGLNLAHNQIRDISPLSGLTNLTGLELRDNLIDDIQGLVDNPGLAGGYVGLRDNDLDLMAGSQDMRGIRLLLDRGVYVEYGP